MSAGQKQIEPTAPTEIEDQHLDVAGGAFPMIQQALGRNDTLKAMPGDGSVKPLLGDGSVKPTG